MSQKHIDNAMLSADSSLLLVIDMQERLLPAIHENEALRKRVERLMQAARHVDVPVVATEHWPDKIGHTHPDIARFADSTFAKTHFDCCREADFLQQLVSGRKRVLLTGVEAHICVLQTGLGLASQGYRPVLLADGIGSRHTLDRDTAIARWQHYGLETVTSEMAIYEWLQTPAHPAFRDILALVR